MVAGIDEMRVYIIGECWGFGEISKIFGGAHESMMDEYISVSVVVVFE